MTHASLLVYCFPTYSRSMHYNSKNNAIVLAPDEMLLCLSKDHKVTVVNMCPFEADKPLMRSQIMMVRPTDINPAHYDYCWHMFRDPLPLEVDAIADQLPSCFAPNKIINNVEGLRKHFKSNYIRTLCNHGIGPELVSAEEIKNVVWGPSQWGVSVSECKKYIKAYNYNNCRGDYPEWEAKKDVVVHYLDAAKDGKRSFFRIGYAFGEITEGWLYTQADNALVQKTGTCETKERHSPDVRFHPAIKSAMMEMRLDTAHLEGCYVNDQLYIFDVNPYPTSYGGTLAPMSADMATVISRVMDTH